MIKSKGTYDVNSNVTEKSVITAKVCPEVSQQTPEMTPNTPEVTQKTPEVTQKTPEVTQKTKSVTLSKRASKTYLEVEEVKLDIKNFTSFNDANYQS